MALIFFAVALNLGQIAQLKATTQVAADTAAAAMASFFTSYTESVYQTQLGGQKGAGTDLTICAWSGVFVLLLKIFILAHIIVATFILGFLFPPLWSITVLAIIALALTIAAMVMQILIIEPGITSLWNKAQRDLLPTFQDRWLEQGVQIAIQNVVTDTALVEDVHDIDQDGFFGKDALGKPKDKISRYATYYTERLRTMQASTQTKDEIEKFKTSLQEFLNFLWDPVDCGANPGHACCGAAPPSECNLCCVDKTVAEREACCDHPNPLLRCGTAATCSSSSYGGSVDPVTLDQATPYPFVYDPLFEDASNGVFSYRERFGTDDEQLEFQTSPPRDHTDFTTGIPKLQAPDPELDKPTMTVFRFDDAKTFSAASQEVFPIFYKFSDWGMDLGRLKLDVADKHLRYECHLCTSAFPKCGDISPLLAAPSLANELAPQLTLPNPPGFSNGGECVFDINDIIDNSKKILRPDLVKTIEELIVLPEKYDDECGFDLVNQFTGKWKRGGDRFCSTAWPYYANGCSKFGTGCKDGGCIADCLAAGGTAAECDVECTHECPCGDPSAGSPLLWPDDPFDNFIYGLTDFILWAQSISTTDTDSLLVNFKQWYPEFATWLAPKAEGSARDPFLNGEEDGYVLIWGDQHQDWINKIDKWLTGPYVGSNCDQTLCLPDPAQFTGIPDAWPARPVGTPTGQCPGLKKTESDLFGTGDVEDIAACLNYNGAAIPRFSQCADSAATCTEFVEPAPGGVTPRCAQLPRSILINDPVFPFDTNDFVVPRDVDVKAFEDCLNDCTKCASLPVSPTPWQGPVGPVIPQYDSAVVVAPATCTLTFTPASGPAGTLLTAEWTSSNDADNSLEYYCSDGISGSVTPANSSAGGVSFPKTTTCILRALNTNGEAATCEATFTVDPLPPATCTLTFTPASGPPGTLFTAEWTSNDLDDDIFYICSDGVTTGHTTASGSASLTSSKTTTCILEVENSATKIGTCSATFTDTSAVSPPSCTLTFIRTADGGPPIGPPGTPLTAFWTSNDDDGNIPYVCSDGASSPPNPPISPAIGSQPASFLKTTTCVLRVENAAGETATCSATFTDSSKETPTCALTFTPSGGPPGTPLTANWTSTDADGSIPWYCSDGSSGTVSPATGTASGFSFLNTTTCVIRAENSLGEAAACTATFTSSTGPSCTGWVPGNPFYDAVVRSWIQAKGSCYDTNPWGTAAGSVDGKIFTFDWQLKLLNSGDAAHASMAAPEGANQLAKLKKRRDFLTARQTEINNLKTLFQSALTEFDKIITAGDKLIDERKKVEDNPDEPLPGFAIYGWQTAIPEGQSKLGRGRWHLVSVETRLPGRCGGNCGQQGNPGGAGGKPIEPPLATVKTYTKKFLFLPIKRCYSLGDAFGLHGGCDSSKEYAKTNQCFLGGTTKVRVRRWDEDKDVLLKFASGLDIWRFRFRNPGVLTALPNVNDLQDLTSPSPICKPLDEGPGAFMLTWPPGDKVPGVTDTPEYAECWARANEIVLHGVKTEVCAEYWWHGSDPPDFPSIGLINSERGFNLKFVDCQGAW